MASSASAVALPWRLLGSAASQSAYSDCSVNCADGVTPTLGAAASIGRSAQSGDGRGRFDLLAGAIAGLAFGVA